MLTMERLVQQTPLMSPPSSNPSVPGVTHLLTIPLNPSPTDSSPSHHPISFTSPRLSETSEVTVYPSSVSLRVCKCNLYLTVFFLFRLYVFDCY